MGTRELEEFAFPIPIVLCQNVQSLMKYIQLVENAAMKIARNQRMTVSMNNVRRVVSATKVTNVSEIVACRRKNANVLSMKFTNAERIVTKIVEHVQLTVGRRSAAIDVTA